MRTERDVHESTAGIPGGGGGRPCVVWLTGLSGAGKTTIGTLVEQRLSRQGAHVTVLDGDVLRRGLNRDLGFSDADRSENIRRVGEVAHLMVRAGLVVVVTLISPFRADRAAARALFRPGEFVEVFVDVPLAVAEGRDPKGLYQRARAGQIAKFTGIDSPYEPPLHPEVHVRGATTSAEQAAELIVAYLDLPGAGDSVKGSPCPDEVRTHLHSVPSCPTMKTPDAPQGQPYASTDEP